MFFLERLAKFRTPASYSGPTIEHILKPQKIYRRMLTFMITPMANIMEASAEPP